MSDVLLAKGFWERFFTQDNVISFLDGVIEWGKGYADGISLVAIIWGKNWAEIARTSAQPSGWLTFRG